MPIESRYVLSLYLEVPLGLAINSHMFLHKIIVDNTDSFIYIYQKGAEMLIFLLDILKDR